MDRVRHVAKTLMAHYPDYFEKGDA
jgi:hypothetical protein